MLAYTYISHGKFELIDKPYLNFVSVDKLDSWDGVEAVVFSACSTLRHAHLSRRMN